MDNFSILVIEDSFSDADLLSKSFDKVGKSWTITRVERLSEGIAKASTNHFDIALLDLSLPDSDGLQTVENFIAAIPNIPAIVLTIASDEKLAVAAIGIGAQDYLIKGEITPTLLVRAIYYGIERGRLLKQLVQTNADLEAFNFLMAHDLKAPLRTIKMYSEVILEDYADNLDDTAKDYLQRSIASATRLDALIKDMLEYSRMGHSQIELEPVSLAEVVTTVLEDLKLLIEEAQAEVVVEPFSFTVQSSRSILTQVISNLVTNAIKFVPSDTLPIVKIWVESRDRYVRLWVEDNGIGISSEDRQKIFEVFIRLHGINSYPGTGVGLAFVKRGMERLKGCVGLESELGVGSKFWIELLNTEEQ